MGDDATVRFGYDGKALDSGLAGQDRKLDSFAKKTESRFQKLGGVLKSSLGDMLPALGFAAGVAGIKSLMNSMDDLADTSLRLNESAETIQRVEYASKLLASVDAEGLTKSFTKFEKVLGDVENTKANEALKNLGITAGELQRMPLDQKILALSEAFQRARATGTGFKDISDLIGKSAADLVPLLMQTRETIQGMFDEAHIVPDSEVQRMADLNDRIDGFVMNTKSLLTEITGTAIMVGGSIKDIIGGLMEGQSMAEISSRMSADEEKQRENRGKAEEERQRKRQQMAEETERRQQEFAAKEAQRDKEKAQRAADERDRKHETLDLAKQSLDILEAEAKGQTSKAERLKQHYEIQKRSHELSAQGMDHRSAIDQASREYTARYMLENEGRRPRGMHQPMKTRLMGGGLDQFERNQIKDETNMFDQNKPGWRRGANTPVYDAFGDRPRKPGRYMGEADEGSLSSRGRRKMGGGGTSEQAATQQAQAMSRPAENIKDLGTKIDETNTILKVALN